MFSTLFALLYFLDTLSLFALDHDPLPYAFHVAGIIDVSHRLSKSRGFLSPSVSDVSSWFCSEFPHWQEYYRRDPVFFWLCPVNNYPTFEAFFLLPWFMGVSASCVHCKVTLCLFTFNSYSEKSTLKLCNIFIKIEVYLVVYTLAYAHVLLFNSMGYTLLFYTWCVIRSVEAPFMRWGQQSIPGSFWISLPWTWNQSFL
jgi:hypothetical protein